MKNAFLLGMFFIIPSLHSSESLYTLQKREEGLLEEAMWEEESILKELRKPLKKLGTVQALINKYEEELAACQQDLQTQDHLLEGAVPENEDEELACRTTEKECARLRKRITALEIKIPALQKKIRPLALRIDWTSILFQEKHLEGIRAILGYPEETLESDMENRSSTSRRRLYSDLLENDAHEDESARIPRMSVVVTLERDPDGQMTRRVRRNTRMEDA